MAVATTYNTGTASVNAGETSVTGQGTTWLTSGIRAGDLFWAAGLAVRIAAVNSNTSLTLAYAWPGANRAAAAYEIRYTPDSERVLAATREMLTALGANAISPLVGLVPAADKMAFYTGAGAAELATLTSFARSLLDDANAAAFWGTIGATAPPNAAFRRGNVVGAVAHSSGTPTGALIERGNNANGHYVRFADGTQICWGVHPNGEPFSFSAAFSVPPFMASLAGSTPGNPRVATQTAISSTGATIAIYISTTGAGTTNTGTYIAIGRWF
ncbi:hypothetical protein [Shinella sp. BYT-45]|uniref:hypothetical protein n=1 Tax=Shinella sp. BYT-45 TaxID=3377377 RepID=UPI00397F8936